MNHAMNMVAVYTQGKGQSIVTCIHKLSPASGSAESFITIFGQHLLGDSREKKQTGGMIAINHSPIEPLNVSWTDHEVNMIRALNLLTKTTRRNASGFPH